ncbi:MAG: serine/threonine-protein kinase, partial [Jatrophihabitans sp.]|uniref:serine/threonine-protein kinase n=1 Tax=Jatrophihabitans sp. TaxID=1932789 RepID=UPI003F80636A
MRGSGWRVPGYTVEQLLGRGGSSEVWRGRVGRSGDEVALKRVPLTDRAAWQHVRTEAAVLTTLDHPNVVRLHEVVPTRDAVVLVLDLAAGGSLAELLAARGRLSVGEVITAVAPVAAALAHAHAAGVLHGDVSAANILFTAGGLPLLADLGVARLLGDLRPVLSTPAYVDPVVAAGAPPTPPSDVFMLGGVVLHALTGSPTWPATDTETSLAAARLGRTDAAERLAAAAVPDATAAVVRRALDPDPARRGTAAEFALDLRASGRPAPLALAAGRPRAVLQPGPPGRARHAARPDASQLAADELVARHGAVGPLLGGRSGRLGGPCAPTLVDRLAGWRGRDGGPDGTGSPLPPLPPHADVAAPSDAATAPAAPPPRRAASAAQPLADLAPTRLVAPRPRPVLPRPPVRGRRRIGA